MTPQEYFGDWIKVIDFNELNIVLGKLKDINPEDICPQPGNVFRAFKLCPYKELRVVFLGQDPYPQRGVATGILFGNKERTPEDKLSPSLEIIKECCINYGVPHGPIDFDNTLESWAKQGILMINSALTCKVNEIGSHVMLWRKFIVALLKNLSYRDPGLIYVLFGKQAQTFEPYIDSKYNHIIKVEHPAYFARANKIMPCSVFIDINKLLKDQYGETIKWYTEY
nr:MAG TPA: hypothetical protein [Bacteriophage sp.]